jgi:8-oxo-dGTP diphosphatase
MVIQIYLTKAIVRFKDKYLLLKKAKDIIPENVGKWECSGGRIDKDEDPKKAVLREIKEETGLTCDIIKELPFLQMTDQKYNSQCHVFLVKTYSDNVKLSSEHTEYRWVTPEEAKKMPFVLFASLILEYFEHAEEYFK